MYKPYLQLAKPGIVIGNLIAVTGGFLLASHGSVDWFRGALVALGVTLVVASGCVINNVIDRDIDRLMSRTRNRPLVTGRVSVPVALLYGIVLCPVGMGLLYAGARRLLPVALVFVGYVVHVGLYSLYMKRNSIHGTLVGSIAGAMPPVVGYCAASGRFDAAAATLLVMFGLWQIPHSYAIAIFRAHDYQAASIPVFPVVRGFAAAKRHMVLYIAAFIAITLMLGVLGYAGKVYMLVALVAGLYWLLLGVAGRNVGNEAQWARKVFFASIAVVTVLSVTMSVDGYAPPASSRLVFLTRGIGS
ncbi:protoheme IX farnesyltransferase [Paraburkholderia sp. JPY158]|uniref:Protoheme IX farnesyltransferase n=1 Tax=Paraburkholderia atlantica TaxID=2654982 RepID=A0A7W8Q909_PARAM|nr:heme o synthase [Paraburkholderia atlantica]MBB5425956.1 protoheme IX farnesyltransferase [Paraburkholderia atlantica]